MKKIILATIVAVLTITLNAQNPQKSNKAAAAQKAADACLAKAHEAVVETLMAQQYVIRSTDEEKYCEAQGWPDTHKCNFVARAIAKMVLTDVGK